MAERRMFHTAVVESDAFLDMTPAAQALYFHLGMNADDDGFVNGPRQVCRTLGAPVECLQELIDGDFLLWFDGVAVLKHFRLANTLQNDRIKQLSYPELAKNIYILPNRIYTTSKGKRKENLYFSRLERLKRSGIHSDSKRIPKGKEGNGKEKKGTELNQTEGKGTERNDHADSVTLTDDEIGSLCKIMGLEQVMFYNRKLKRFVEEKGATIKDHYATILKWWEEDGGTYYE